MLFLPHFVTKINFLQKRKGRVFRWRRRRTASPSQEERVTEASHSSLAAASPNGRPSEMKIDIFSRKRWPSSWGSSQDSYPGPGQPVMPPGEETARRSGPRPRSPAGKCWLQFLHLHMKVTANVSQWKVTGCSASQETFQLRNWMSHGSVRVPSRHGSHEQIPGQQQFFPALCSPSTPPLLPVRGEVLIWNLIGCRK